MGVAACLLLEYGVSISAVAVGWSGYLNKLLDNLFGVQIPQALSAAPWDTDPGIVNLPAIVLIVMCALLLIRGASESATVNTVMVIDQARRAGDVRRHRVHRVQRRPLRRTSGTPASPESPPRPARSSSPSSAWTPCPPPVTRSRIRRRPCRAPSSRALVIVTSVYVLVAVRRHRRTAGRRLRFRRTGRGRPGGHPGEHHRRHLGQHDSRCGRGDLDLLGHAGGDVRPDPHPVRDGPRRSAAARCSPRSTRRP